MHEARTFVFLCPIEDLSLRFGPTVLGMEMLDRRLIRIPIPAVIHVAKSCRADTKISWGYRAVAGGDPPLARHRSIA